MSDLVNTIAKLATTVGTALGGPAVPAILEIGKDVLKLIDNTKMILHMNDDAQVQLQAIRDELEPKVLAHAEQTENMLRGQ